MDERTRDTIPPPPPPQGDEWQQELRSGFAELQDEVSELARLLMKCYARTSNIAACIGRLIDVVSRPPTN